MERCKAMHCNGANRVAGCVLINPMMVKNGGYGHDQNGDKLCRAFEELMQ